MHTSCRRMLRLYLFVLLPSLISTEENRSRWFYVKKTQQLHVFYCSPAQQKCAVITCLWLLFAQICPHLHLCSSFGSTVQHFQNFCFGAGEPHAQHRSSWRWAHSVKWNMCFKHYWIIYCPWSSLSFINPSKATRTWQPLFFSLPNTSWCDNIKLTVWVGLFSARLLSWNLIRASHRRYHWETWQFVWSADMSLSVCRAVTSRCPGLRPSLRRA